MKLRQNITLWLVSRRRRGTASPLNDAEFLRHGKRSLRQYKCASRGKTFQSGFSPIEVLLAATVFGMITTALAGAIIFARASTASSGNRLRATQIAEEGVEAVRNIGNASFANLADGTYGLAQSGGVWTLSGTSDASGIYTRSVTISTVDVTRKTITANVTWPQQVGAGSVSITARTTNWTTALTSWLNATLAGSYDATGAGNGIKVATVGNYAYIVRASSPNFVVVNVSNPAAPTLVSAYNTQNTPTNIAISGNYAYVTTTLDNSELQIVDISNPAAPAVVGTFDASGKGDGLSVAVSSNYAYLTRAANGGTDEFVVVNVAVPSAPTRVGGYGNNIAMNDVIVDGNYAYVSTSSTTAELIVINVATPASPTLAGSLNLSGNGASLALAKYANNLFITWTSGSNVSRVDTVNVTTPTAPVLSGSLGIGASITLNDICTDPAGTFAFLGTNTGTAELRILDISNPASLSIVKTVDISGGNYSLNGVAYNTSLDILVGASTADTKELVTFVKN